jgi:hypothetical protein
VVQHADVLPESARFVFKNSVKEEYMRTFTKFSRVFEKILPFYIGIWYQMGFLPFGASAECNTCGIRPNTYIKEGIIEISLGITRKS